jgi:hypothetical protein
MTPAQCRVARALADISRAELSGIAVVPCEVIEEFEAGGTMPSEGEPPKPRVTVQVWDSMEKIQAWRILRNTRKTGSSATSTQNSVHSPLRACRNSSL